MAGISAIHSEKHYISGIEYNGTAIEAIYNTEGRVVPNGASWTYEYTLRDHLGNARASFRYNSGVQLIQENHYYPFGMQMEGAWAAQVGTENGYQYNGKELNEDFGLNVYHYGARIYDPAMGRWNHIDPLSEKYFSQTGYQYVSNNPVLMIDPLGLFGENPNDLYKERRKKQEGRTLATDLDVANRAKSVFAMEYNNYAGNEVKRNISDNGVEIYYDGKWVLKKSSSSIEEFISALGSAASMASSTFSAVSMEFYSLENKRFRAADGSIRKIFLHWDIRHPEYKAQLSFAKSASQSAKVLGSTFSFVSYGSTVYGYVSAWEENGGKYPGNEKTIKAVADLGVNTLGFLNIYGAALNVGWEMGRMITYSSEYQNFKRMYIYNNPGGIDGLLSTDF